MIFILHQTANQIMLKSSFGYLTKTNCCVVDIIETWKYMSTNDGKAHKSCDNNQILRISSLLFTDEAEVESKMAFECDVNDVFVKEVRQKVIQALYQNKNKS